MEGRSVGGQGLCFVSSRFWRLAIFAATGTLAITSQAEATLYYWEDSTPGVVEPAPSAEVRRPKAHAHREKKSNLVQKNPAKPQGPLIISISIAQQRLRLYDANGLFAESPVSTGMPGHPTPMGVFSVIQKQRFHKSNIYSGAPMPYMQRITWSGIALHAGLLPGYPASHGCIRMPSAFAIKMWSWTRMGARVIVTPGDVTPASFSHPLLATAKAEPQPATAEQTKADAGAVQAPEAPAQLGAQTATAAVEAKPADIKPADIKAAETNIELRSTVGHTDVLKSTMDAGHASEVSPTKTADASGALSATGATSDAAPAAEHAPQQMEATASLKPDTAKPASTTSADKQPAKIAGNEAKPLETPNSQTEKLTDTGKAVTAAPPAASATTNGTPLKEDIKSDFAKTPAPRPDADLAFKKAGQIAIFVSRKDSKLYVRQNFSPLFDVPVTISADERPLGTHIFTAQIDRNDANVLHWSVVSLPMPAKSMSRHAKDEHVSHGRSIATTGPVEAKPLPVPDSPAEALNRLGLPADVMAKIYEAISTGGSMIVSDQGITAGETGEGTDFIVSLH